MDTATRVQILDEADCISQSTNIFAERYETNYPTSSYGQIVEKTGFFSLGTSQGEGKL